MENCDLLLINPPFHKRNGSGNIFPLGLGYLYASAKKSGYSVCIIDCTDIISSFESVNLDVLKEDLVIRLLKYAPKLIGIGPCITTQIAALKIIVDCCKNTLRGVPIIAGGPLASIEGQEWVFYEYLGINTIIKGDGEIAIVDALKAISNGENLVSCNKITSKNNLFYNEIANLDTIPFPYRYNFENYCISYRRSDGEENQKTATMIASRGCANKCDYCVSGNLKHQTLRKRSIPNVIEEMRYLQNNYNVTDIVFYDDCFFYNTHSANEDVEKFCSALLDSGTSMKWQMELRTDFVIEMSNKSIAFLEQCGCRQINIGIEKTTDKELFSLGKTSSVSGLKAAILRIKDNSNIKLTGTFILGGPEESEADIKKMIIDSTLLGLDTVQYNPLYIYPGTPLYDKTIKDTRKWLYYALDNMPLGEIIFENEYVNKDKLINLLDYAYAEFYKDTSMRNDLMVTDRLNLRRGGENEDF